MDLRAAMVTARMERRPLLLEQGACVAVTNADVWTGRICLNTLDEPEFLTHEHNNNNPAALLEH